MQETFHAQFPVSVKSLVTSDLGKNCDNVEKRQAGGLVNNLDAVCFSMAVLPFRLSSAVFFHSFENSLLLHNSDSFMPNCLALLILSSW